MARKSQPVIAATLEAEKALPLPRNARSVLIVALRLSAPLTKREIAIMRRLTIVALVFGLLSACAFAQGTGQSAGKVQGQVFIKDADGGRSVVPGKRITLDGP